MGLCDPPERQPPLPHLVMRIRGDAPLAEE
jgi:hypothetical protein